MDPTAGWSLHLGLPKTVSTLLQEHLFGRHPDLDYLGKLDAKWVSLEVEKFVRRITTAQQLDWSGSGWIHRIEKQTAQGNRWLAQTFGLPLAEYEYPM